MMDENAGKCDLDGSLVESTPESVQYWPYLSFEYFPKRQYHIHHEFKNPSGKQKTVENNFFKGLKWSPDGSCFLTSSENNSLHIFDLPSDAIEDCPEVDMSSCEDSFKSSLMVQEGEAVYDFCWFPVMAASDTSSCVFATSSRDHPVHVWDATTGKLRCTYRAYDQMDEITAAYSISFNPAGSKLFCGYNKTIRIFDTSRPGREFTQHSTLTSAKDGQTGIISCLAFNAVNGGLLAAGSYNRTTALYDENSLELLFVLHGQQGGVTQVMFSKDGNFLYSGARKDPEILCWDIRNTAGVLYRLPRVTADTNQRVAFDIEPFGRHLGTGGQDGLVHFYDLQTGDWVNSFQAALDTVNSFCFHPSLPLAASASGHRRFVVDTEPDSDDQGYTVLLKEEENCASVWRFPCTWVNSQEQSTTATHGDECDYTVTEALNDNTLT
ncbi:telomerase Cajal body protein 1 [Marchantia polymorpha subsp. ruderalis]|nr:hypothetical protein MARPO_0082s0056 [Marchantia polymorpha]BBN02469.1 hypothetical protein Mp_2g15590 [Marchantia polymorpha subsp. ruderalis]|eukprot:PTQ34217.1 hypothetical protein MARPO_0082s0056 [Marchantia polymorpha]